MAATTRRRGGDKEHQLLPQPPTTSFAPAAADDGSEDADDGRPLPSVVGGFLDAARPAPSALLDPTRVAPFSHLPWTVYRGAAYDLTPFRARHPGGAFLVDLAAHRDATALVESYHLRTEVARRVIEGLPRIAGFPVDAVEASPRPDDSEFYVAVKRRVRAEVFGQRAVPGLTGRDGGGGEAPAPAPGAVPSRRPPGRLHPRRGSETAMAVVLLSSALLYALFALSPGPLTGALLGLAGAWIGVTVQHCGNHGAMSTSPLANWLLGFTDDLIGGSSLVWRYHHQVSHHVHTNDGRLDEDVVSMYPALRFDTRLPLRPWHRFQHLYVWLAYPVMHCAFQWGDVAALVTGKTAGCDTSGARAGEKAALVLGKALHFAGLLLVPAVGVPAAMAAMAGVGGGGGFAGDGAGCAAAAALWPPVPGSAADPPAFGGGAAAVAPMPPPPPGFGAPPAPAPAPSTLFAEAAAAGAAGGPVVAAAAALRSSCDLLLLAAPPFFASRWAATLAGAATYSVVLSFVLALMFFVSHNVPENKPVRGEEEEEGREEREEREGEGEAAADRGRDAGALPHLPARAALLAHPAPAGRDWGLQQVLASANWGGKVANFVTGGLNLQIEHHLFPAVAFAHYPAIAEVVSDECARRGVPYAAYPDLPSILRSFVACMRTLGSAPDEPGGLLGASLGGGGGGGNGGGGATAAGAAAAAAAAPDRGAKAAAETASSAPGSGGGGGGALMPADGVPAGAAAASARAVRAATDAQRRARGEAALAVEAA